MIVCERGKRNEERGKKADETVTESLKGLTAKYAMDSELGLDHIYTCTKSWSKLSILRVEPQEVEDRFNQLSDRSSLSSCRNVPPPPQY